MIVDYLSRLARWLTDVLWPLRCASCGHLGTAACTTCLARLEPLVPQRCPGCGRPSRSGFPCPGCRGRMHLDRLIAATGFGSACEALVHAFKYRGVRSLAPPLADRMCDIAVRMPAAERPIAHASVIVPVPLHRSRLRERGYNQAELLARRIALNAALPVRTDILTRVRATAQQAKTLSRAERRENITGSFCSSPAAEGLEILLVDDVATTGATLDDCARALKEAGARSVTGFTLARG